MTQHEDRPVIPQPPRTGIAALVWLGIVYAVALGLSIMLVVRGQYDVGSAGALMVLTLGPVAFMLALAHVDRRRQAVADRVDELSRAVHTLTSQASLSNDARRVLNRSAERDLLRQAIEEDIETKNWDAAMVLIKELADNFGYRADAEEFRHKIDASRAQTLDRDVTEAISYLDGLIIQRRWDAALIDAARLQRLFPDSPRVDGLRARVSHAIASYKADLEKRFLQAAHEGRSDDAMSLMKELDPYLSLSEAQPLREMARGVIGKARDDLGNGFRVAVQDRQWRDAARIGDRIIAEFPNSRMAAEVKDVIDGIRIRASEVQPA